MMENFLFRKPFTFYYPPMTDPAPAKQTSARQDFVVIAIALLLIVSLISGLVYCLKTVLKRDKQAAISASEAPATPSGESSAPTGATQPALPAVSEQGKADPSLASKASTVQQAAETIDLGMASQDVLKDLGLKILGFDLKQARLVVKASDAKFRLSIPVGLQLKPRTGTNISAYLVVSHCVLDVPVSPQDSSFFIPVASTDFRFLRAAMNGAEFDLSRPEQGEVQDFLAFAASRTSSWNVVQTGIWVLKGDISRQELSGFRVAYPDPAAAGGTRMESLASFEDVKSVEGILSALGRDPDTLKLIVEEREERNRLVKQVDFDRQSPACLSILRARTLARYKGDSEIERILRQYMTQHRRFDVRRLALENLVQMGQQGTEQELFRKAVYDSDINNRYIAATTLFSRGNMTSLPALALCADDPILGSLCMDKVAAAIQKQSGQAKMAGESMYDYWTRAIGWAASGVIQQQQEYARNTLDAAAQKSDAALVQALTDIVSADDSKASSACYALARFSRSRKAFDALCRTALQPRSVNVRQAALNSIRSFRDFCPANVCDQIIKQDSDQLVYSVLALIQNVQYPGFEEALLKAIRHSSDGVRRQATELVGLSQVVEAEKELSKMAQYDPDQLLKQTALEALARMRSGECISICQSLLRGGNPSEKRRAVSALRLWDEESRALELLQKYKRDPDVGQQINAQLSKYAQ